MLISTGWDAILSFHSHFQSLKSLASFVSCLCWPWSTSSSFWLCFPFIIFIISSVDLFSGLLPLIPYLTSTPFGADGVSIILGGSRTMFPKVSSTWTVIWAHVALGTISTATQTPTWNNTESHSKRVIPFAILSQSSWLFQGKSFHLVLICPSLTNIPFEKRESRP